MKKYRSRKSRDTSNTFDKYIDLARLMPSHLLYLLGIKNVIEKLDVEYLTEQKNDVIAKIAEIDSKLDALQREAGTIMRSRRQNTVRLQEISDEQDKLEMKKQAKERKIVYFDDMIDQVANQGLLKVRQTLEKLPFYPNVDLIPYLSSGSASMIPNFQPDQKSVFMARYDVLKMRLEDTLTVLNDMPKIEGNNWFSADAGYCIAGGFLFNLANDNIFKSGKVLDKDIDIFIYGKDRQSKDTVLFTLINFFKDLDAKIEYMDALVSVKYKKFNFQLVLSGYKSPYDVISYFDLSYIQIYFDGEYIVCSPECSYYAMYGEAIIAYPLLTNKRVVKAYKKGVKPVYKDINFVYSGSQYRGQIFKSIENKLFYPSGKEIVQKETTYPTISEEQFVQDHVYPVFTTGGYISTKYVDAADLPREVFENETYIDVTGLNPNNTYMMKVVKSDFNLETRELLLKMNVLAQETYGVYNFGYNDTYFINRNNKINFPGSREHQIKSNIFSSYLKYKTFRYMLLKMRFVFSGWDIEPYIVFT